jgi:predicted negative regulator of RcsB-dependent stress response
MISKETMRVFKLSFSIKLNPNKILIPIIVALFFLADNVYAQYSIVKDVKKGLDLGYNFYWDKAERTFKGIILKYPNDPRGYHYEASIYFWDYLSTKNKKSYNTFIAYSDTAVDKANAFLDKNPHNIDILYTLGADYSYRTLVFAKAEKFLDAVWASKKSESNLIKALEIDSSYYDAYLGLGLYYFGVGQIPSSFRWALNLAGIHGDKKLGLSYIKKAANFGNLSKVEADYFYSQILTDYKFEYEQASHYLQNLTNGYPENLLFSYSSAVLNIKRRRLNDAERILTKIINSRDESFKQIISFSNFLMGDIYFKKNQFEDAEQYYFTFISTSINEDYKGIAYLRLALCYEISGDRNDAVKYFNLCDKGNMDIEDDIFAQREGSIYSGRALAATEIDLIKYSNMIDNGKYKNAIDSLLDLLDRVKTERLKAMINLYLSEAAYHLGQYNESLNYAVASKSLECAEEKWVRPYAVYYAARANEKMGDENQEKKFADEAQSYSNYDYQKKLNNLISALLDKD